MQQSIQGEGRKFMASDENALIMDIMAVHIPDGRDIDVKSILQIVEDIFISATPTVAEDTSKEVSEGTSKKADVAASMLEPFTYIVTQLSTEISYKCMIGEEGHSTTVSLFSMLSSYSWDAKLVLALAAFALNYGEFLLHIQIYSTNKLVRRMEILKQSPDIKEHFVQLIPLLDSQNNLIKSMLELVRCIVTFKELPTRYLSPDNAAFSAAITVIPTASYWIIRSVIVCARNITYHNGTGHEYNLSTAEEILGEVSMMNYEIKTTNNYLQKQLAICHHNVEERKHHEAYEALVHSLEDDHVDNVRSLKLLIRPKDNLQPLFDGSTNKLVDIEVVKGKTVLLLIADTGAMSEMELFVLEKIYKESRMHATKVESKFEIIYIPMVNSSTPWTDETQKHSGSSTQTQMPWLSLYHQGLIDQVVIMRFIKENLHFEDKPMVMVIDPQGKMVSPNALSMMYIWGIHGFPFSISREKALWKEATWGLELLVGDIDVNITTWINEEKHIFLYGGDDIDWDKQFTDNVGRVAKSARIPLEMIYVGIHAEHENLENLSRTLPDSKMRSLFWYRLETMINSSKNGLANNSAAEQEQLVLQEIKKLVGNETSRVPWALYIKGGDIVVNGSGSIILSALREYDAWAKDVEANGFDVAFKEYYDKLYDAAHPGYSVEFPATTDQFVKIPEKMKCPKCYYFMEKYVGFSCCHSLIQNYKK